MHIFTKIVVLAAAAVVAANNYTDGEVCGEKGENSDAVSLLWQKKKDEPMAKAPNTHSGYPIIPDTLVAEVAAGNVVGFIGAGFSYGANLPSWGDLLLKVAAQGMAGSAEFGTASADLETRVKAMIKPANEGRPDYEGAAALIDTELNAACKAHHHGMNCNFQEPLVAYIHICLKIELPVNAKMHKRLDTLPKIKFHALLSTNYDPFVQGTTPAHRDVGNWYSHILTGHPHVPNGEIVDRHSSGHLAFVNAGCPVIQIHGNLYTPESVVLTKISYQALLNKKSYTDFVYQLFKAKITFFIGSSLSDEYVEEYQTHVYRELEDAATSHCTSIFSACGGQHHIEACECRPIAYALMPDKFTKQKDLEKWRATRGVEVILWGLDKYEDGIGKALEMVCMEGGHRPGVASCW